MHRHNARRNRAGLHGLQNELRLQAADFRAKLDAHLGRMAELAENERLVSVARQGNFEIPEGADPDEVRRANFAELEAIEAKLSVLRSTYANERQALAGYRESIGAACRKHGISNVDIPYVPEHRSGTSSAGMTSRTYEV